MGEKCEKQGFAMRMIAALVLVCMCAINVNAKIASYSQKSVADLIKEAQAMRAELESAQTKPSPPTPNQNNHHTPTTAVRARSTAAVTPAVAKPRVAAVAVATAKDAEEISDIQREVNIVQSEIHKLERQQPVTKATNIPAWLTRVDAQTLRRIVANDKVLLTRAELLLGRNSKTKVVTVQSTDINEAAANTGDFAADAMEKPAESSETSVAPISDGEQGGSLPSLAFMHPTHGGSTGSLTKTEYPIALPGLLSSLGGSGGSVGSSFSVAGSKKKKVKRSREESSEDGSDSSESEVEE